MPHSHPKSGRTSHPYWPCSAARRTERTDRGGSAYSSYLTITHPTADFNAEEMAGAVAAAQYAGITLVPRSKSEVEAFFAGLELIDPGVAPVLAWHPDAQPEEPRSAYYYAAIGRKP